MRNEKIEKLRERINLMIVSENVSAEDLLKLSRELDELIAEYISGQLFNP